MEKVPQQKPAGPEAGTESNMQRTASPVPFSLAASPVDAPARESGKKPFKPKLGTKTTKFAGTFGDFEVTHGLQSRPKPTAYGGYEAKIEMAPNEAAKGKKVAFVQVARQSKSGGGISMKADDYKMDDYFAGLTEQESGWALDRANASRDQTPFYGMYKDPAGAVQQYSTSQIGEFGGNKAMLYDVPSVGYTDKMEFVATATDMASGAKMGAVEWGFEYNGETKLYRETTPRLLEDADAKVTGRDRAYTKWNNDIAKGNIDKVPGV